MSSQITIDVWPIELRGVTSDADLAVLSGPETDRAARRRKPEDAAEFVTVRAALRRRLGEALGVAPQAVPLVDRVGLGPVLDLGPDPELPAGPRFRDRAAGLWFNVSHTGGLALVAIARGTRIGVDIERIAPVTEELAAVILSAGERLEVQTLPQSERARAVVRAWTRKEAVLKGLGEGLSSDPTALSVSLAASVADAVVGGLQSDWRVFSVAVGPEWEAAVAVARQQLPVDLRLHPRETAFTASTPDGSADEIANH